MNPIGTFWNGLPCKATVVRVIVAKAEKPTFWYAGLAGTERVAVKVEQGGETFYLDNDDWELAAKGEGAGHGWRKVTIGRGSPSWGHRSLSVEREVGSSS